MRREDGRGQVELLPANAASAWQAAALEAGRWSHLVADAMGFIWVLDKNGLRRLYPHKVDEGWRKIEREWRAVVEGLQEDEISALGLSPDDMVMAAFASGELVELDVSAEGQIISRLLARTSGPVRRMHTDEWGHIWAATDSGLYRRTAKAGAWQKTWRRLGRLPGGNHDIFAVPLQGKLYVAGGLTSGWGFPARTHVFDELFTYDAASERWNVASRMPFPRCYNGIAELDGAIWVVGGSANLEDPDGKRRSVNDVDIYDPESDRWTAAPPLNTARIEPIVLTANGRIYAIGGSEDGEEALSTIESIAPGEDAWRFETSSPSPIRQAAGCVLDGMIYCMSKEGFLAYDAQKGTWDDTLPQLDESPQAPLVTAFQDEVWVLGGYRFKTCHRYSPGEKRWRSGPSLPTEQSWAAAVVLNEELIVVGGAHRSDVHKAFIFDDRVYVLRQEADY